MTIGGESGPVEPGNPTSMDARRFTYNPSLGEVIDDAVASDVDDGWLIAHSVTPETRTASLRAVFMDGQPRWQSAFSVMLLLAAGIAALGLSENSAATVIGSMIIAPLGQPIDVVGDTVTVTVSDPSNLDIGSVEKAVRSVMGSGVAVTVTGP